MTDNKKTDTEIKEKLVAINRITKVVKGVSSNSNDNLKVENEVRKEVVELCSKFPIYKNLR